VQHRRGNYIDSVSETPTSAYLLAQRPKGKYAVHNLEVKGDNLIQDPVVQAKKQFAEAIA